MSKKLSKFIAVPNYFDKTLIVLLVTSEGISIISFVNVIGTPAGIVSASFTLLFSFTARIIKNLFEKTNKKKRKCIIKLLCLLKLNYIVLKLKSTHILSINRS